MCYYKFVPATKGRTSHITSQNTSQHVSHILINIGQPAMPKIKFEFEWRTCLADPNPGLRAQTVNPQNALTVLTAITTTTTTTTQVIQVATIKKC